VQLGFLILFLLPLIPLVYERLTYQAATDYASWLLPWDPMLAIGNVFNRNFSALIIGAPLLLLSLSLVLGRSFCGWVCPLGTVMDLARPLTSWLGKRRSKGTTGKDRRNSRMRYLLLAAALGGSFLSIKLLGLVDPLIIFSRAATAAVVNLLGSQQALERGGLTYFSLLFIVILLLEFFQPRFWCRHLCPQGGLLSLVTRFSLLNRVVSKACSNCDICKQVCPMDAIPDDAHDTDYSDCTFCLECKPACAKNGISFEFGSLALAEWRPKVQAADSGKAKHRKGAYVASTSTVPGEGISRHQFLQGMAAAVAGLVFMPLTQLERRQTPLRPPGALPESGFLNVCIACQECIRVCPTQGLQSAFVQTGLSGIGMPMLIPRRGGCSLGVSCNHLCAQVCPVDAIQPVDQTHFTIGFAVVNHSLCLAWDQGVKCLVCVEACQSYAAIPHQGKVIINTESCIGCGFCESGCPVPGSAIHVYPNDYSTV
jgi:polyferredoxin